MITLAKAQIYAKFSGDIDSWLKHGSSEEREVIAAGDWSLMENIVDDLSLQKKKRQAQLSDKNKERTYTPMSDAQYQKAVEETERFMGVVNANEYEDVLSELWRYA